ncbi:MAG: hypothetical protein Q6373_016215 [Candidatus Sigynarchaeota archaeon]
MKRHKARVTEMIIWLGVTWMLAAFLMQPASFVEKTCSGIKTSDGQLPDMTLDWMQTWGRNMADDYGSGVAVGMDGIYITGQSNVGDTDAFIVKYSSDGTQLWNSTWGGIQYDYVNDVAVAPDEVYIAGFTSSFGSGGDGFLVKYTSTGVQLWNKTWGGLDEDEACGIAVASDAVYIAGVTKSFGRGGGDAFIAKFDASGILLWNQTWGGFNYDRAIKIAAATDGIFIVGETYSFGSGGSDAFVAKYAPSGAQLWNCTWGMGTHETGMDIAVTSGAIYIVGRQDIPALDVDGAFIVKFNATGAVTWSRTIGDVNDKRFECKTPGSSRSPRPKPELAYLVSLQLN